VSAPPRGGQLWKGGWGWWVGVALRRFHCVVLPLGPWAVMQLSLCAALHSSACPLYCVQCPVYYVLCTVCSVLCAGVALQVYKAQLRSGELVAVKRAKPDRKQDLTKFRKEVELLSRVSHKHLVRLAGYCKEGEQLLVYEYIAGGTLRRTSTAPGEPVSAHCSCSVGAGAGVAGARAVSAPATPEVHASQSSYTMSMLL